MSATCGPEWQQPFVFYDPDECCWRTLQATFLWDSDRYSETWPRSGMTRGGYAYELPMPALRMVVSESSWLLPTPGVAGGGKKIPEDAIWSGKAAYKQDGRKVQVHLDQIARLLPTPNARDWKGQPGPGWDEQASLPRAVALLPTPTAQDSAGSRGYQPNGEPYTATAGVTLTDAALSSSGAHMPPRLRGGKPSQDDLLPDLLSLARDAESA